MAVEQLTGQCHGCADCMMFEAQIEMLMIRNSAKAADMCMVL